MKRWRIFFLILSAAALAAVLYSEAFRMREAPVYLVYDQEELKDYGHIINAYESVLAEEGVPFSRVKASFLLSRNSEALGKSGSAVIFPDGAAQFLPDGIKAWTRDFLNAGGCAAVIYDAGIRGRTGAFLEKSVFTDILGLNSITYSRNKEMSFGSGQFKFRDKAAADFFQMPSGKLDKDLFLNGYIYGRLIYPMARAETLPGLNSSDVKAEVVNKPGESYPGIILKETGKGRLLYVNMPLGRDKAYSDDLPLRAFLRTFLFKAAHVPHLVNAPDAKGGIVINWHIDSAVELKGIQWALQNGYFDPALKYSIDITAGDFRDKPGDGLGFDACGKGKDLVRRLMEYGTVGSHGGWGHNWFAAGIESGAFGEKDIEYNISRNNDCLASITGYPITEYAAPEGVHPLEATKALERLGMKAYYYTGDTGSAPNRSFLNGKMVSDKVFAFPVMPFENDASLYEMHESSRTEKEVTDWLLSVADYAERNKTVRLVYSHIHDIQSDYPNAIKRLERYLVERKAAGALRVNSMAYFAGFIERLLKTSYTFSSKRGGLSFKASNPERLGEITAALPADRFEKPEGRRVHEDADGYYYVKLNDVQKDEFFAPAR